MRFLWWRFRVALYIWATFDWTWASAWSYAKEMRDPYYIGEDGPMDPREAVSEDRHYWD